MAYILLENRKTQCGQKNSHYFHGAYERIHCNRPDEVRDCLRKIDAARRAGKYLVGYISYEVGFCLHAKLTPLLQQSFNYALVDFYVFAKHELLSQAEVGQLLQDLTEIDSSEAFIYDINYNFDYNNYATKLAKIKAYLRDGETYQVNFTGQYDFFLQGNLVNLYKQLRERQKVEFAALFNCKDVQVLSLSPELFFAKRGESLFAKPMKGTLSRTHDDSINAINQDRLLNDAKIIAENMIIVDLIRNDLSIIAQPQSVHVPKLFAIEEYETVYQMTSTVACKVDKEKNFSDIITAIFPCGSITGAPKLRTMQIIKELEQRDRKLYTGAIGYITPANDMCFNVAIRTIQFTGNQGEMGVGGGIVHDSVIRDEYHEVAVKAKFLTELPLPFNLIECFLYESEGGFRYLNQHLQRLCNSARFFSFQFSKNIILCKLQQVAKNLNSNHRYKIKLILRQNGDCQVVTYKLDDELIKPKIKLAVINFDTEKNILLQHKTDAKSVRDFYDKVLQREITKHDLFDVIFINKNGLITEGSKANIFIAKQGKIFTPPVTCGLLPGIMRKNFIERYPQIQEVCLRKEDVISADKIWITNSVRGIVEAELVND